MNLFYKILKIIHEQRGIPYFLRKKPKVKYFEIKYLFRPQKWDFSKVPYTKFTIIIPHKDVPDFLSVAVNSIETFFDGEDYKVIIVDDGSQEKFLNSLKVISKRPNIYLFSFESSEGHPYILEWMFLKSASNYVITLDQDSILVSNDWKILEKEFEENKDLCVIGVRDVPAGRFSPQMIHPSFIFINKIRLQKRLKPPYFFGPKPNYEQYKIGAYEPYHSLSCRLLSLQEKENKKLIDYLEVHNTKYGLGSVGYWRDKSCKIMYHHWFSGRIFRSDIKDVIDGYKVSDLIAYRDKFFSDYNSGRLDLGEPTPS